jgi:hypothetical protein
MPNTFVKRALCFGATALAIGAVAAPAQAASPFVRNTANCPAGKVALGGGEQVVGEGTADFQTALQESTPGTVGGGATSLWLNAVRNNSGLQHTIGMFAVCANAPAGYEVIRHDVPLPANGFVRDTAVCPTGKVALAGGAQVVGAGTGNFGTRMYESSPGTINGGAQSLWLVAMKSNTRVARTIGIFAVCGNAPAGYQVVRHDYSVPAGGFLRNTSACPVGKVILGGGSAVIGAGTGNFNTRLQELAPGQVGAGSSLQSVQLASLRNNSAVTRTIGISAVCANPLSAYQVVRSDYVTG